MLKMPPVALIIFLALLVVAAAATQQDPSTGHISPGSGVPDFDPAPWNTAYKVTLRNAPFKGPKEWPHAPLSDVNTPSSCSEQGFDTTSASSVPLNTCFYKTSNNQSFDFWTVVPSAALKNGNCYCYALNYFKGGYCLPGTSKGGRTRREYESQMTCDTLNQAMADDGATCVTREAVMSGQPSSGHYIVIMARPGGCIPGHCGNSDFHAMRKDSSGTWSWKLPSHPASDKDLQGRPIYDPEAAPLPGHYFVCGYYQVEPDKMTVGVSSKARSEGPVDDTLIQDTYKGLSGVELDVSPVTYVKAILKPRDQSVFDEDAAWERKRGSKEYEDWKKQQMKALGLEGGASTDSSSTTSGGKTTSSGGAAAQPSPGGSASSGAGGGGSDLSSGGGTFQSGRKLRRLLLQHTQVV